MDLFWAWYSILLQSEKQYEKTKCDVPGTGKTGSYSNAALLLPGATMKENIFVFDHKS